MQDRLTEAEGAPALPAPSRARASPTDARERIAGYLFVAPDAIGLLIFVGGPMILSLSLGFFSVSGFGEYAFVGLDNYRRMIADPLFWRSLEVTVLYVVALVPSALCRRPWAGAPGAVELALQHCRRAASCSCRRR